MRLLHFARNDRYVKPYQPVNSVKQNGYLLLPVVVVITLVAAIALMMNTESALESNTAATELDTQQAEYVAEAGLNHALWLARQQGCGPYTDITNHPLAADKYGTSLTTDLGSTTSVTINVDQDTWIRSDLPTENKAADVKLHTRNEAAGIERPMLRYDLSPIAAKASIVSATAWFYVTNDHAEGPIDIHLITADWAEIDATWDSMNANMDAAVLATVPSQPATDVWLPVNLTAQVQAWVNGQVNYGITLNSTVDGVHGQYNSRESANPPYLEVVLGVPPSSPAMLKSVGTLANGTSRTIQRTDIVLRQNPPMYHYAQLDPDQVEDAWITGTQPDWSYGGHNSLNVNEGGGPQRGLIRFDMADALPEGARLTSATLELFASSAGGSGQTRLYGLRQDWVEGDCSGPGGCAQGVTWDTVDGTNPWSLSGGVADDTAVAEVQTGSSDAWYSWDITAIARQWQEGARENNGLLIQGEGADMTFHSSDNVDATTHPRITLGYSCACGIVCLPPQGSGKIVMIGNYAGVNPDPRDLEKEAIIESWGYEVDQADHYFIWAINFNNYDAVYVSETASSAAVTGQLDWRSIGIVNEQGNLNNDLGFASANNTTTGDSLDITDNDHYISTPFALGPLSIYDADMEIIYASGSLATGMQTLGETGGADSLMTLDTGATGINGPAAGRRVALPLGRDTNSNFNWDYLNNNGRLLVQRSLEWASGAGSLPTIGSLLLVVNDDGNLTTQENAKKALFESWSYAVNIIDSGDSQAAFDAAAAANDVVFITEDINSGDLGSKLVDATIGVVTEEDNLSDEFGFSDGIHWGSGTALKINNSHYITQPLAEGTVTIFTSSESLADLTGALAPDIQTLGVSVDGPALAAIDVGDSLILGGTAQGRRVILPWGGDNFDVNHLNADGLTILRRSLEWADGANLDGGFYLDEFPDFSCDGADEYRGSNGSLDWSGFAWTESGDDGRACGANLRVLDDPLIADPTGNRLRLQNSDRGVERLVDLSSFAAAYLSFDYRREGLSGGAAIVVEVSGDGGSNWNTLDTIGAGTDADYQSADYDISTYMAADTMIRFSSNSSFSGEAYIDNVRIDQSTGPTGPIAHWKLDETVGPTAVDSEGSNDGTWINGPAPAPGVDAGGLDFDGSNDYVDAGSFDVTGSGITMMAWFNAEALTTTDERIISKAAGTAEADAWWQLSSSNSGSDRFLRMRIKAGGITTTLADSSVSLSTSTWYLAAATYDNASGEMKLYLDGVEIASTTHAAGGALDVNPSVPVAIGANGTAQRFFDGILDDVRVYDRALSTGEISDLYAVSAPPAPGYTEIFQPWSAVNDDIWETFDLGTFGVPADAVVEVAIVNADTGKEQWAGVRAVGSSLERRFLLHEAEGGGLDTLTLHVQADADSRIQHYTSKKGETSFVLLGYWTTGSYVELFDSFTANGDGTWINENLGSVGLGPNQIAEIVILNTDTGAQRIAGVRTPGLGLQRRFTLHEAESGGVDAVSMMVNTDGSSRIQLYAQDDSDIDYYAVGYWSTPPGTYTETGGVQGQATAPSAWQTGDLTAFGVPANSIAQFVISSEISNSEHELGVRQIGSAEHRAIQLQEAEAGGSDNASMHVNVDASSQIEWYSQDGTSDRYFYPVGWWVLSP